MMRLRDIFILFVAIIFCIFGWYQEGGISVWRSFKIPIGDSEVQRYVVAKPVVVDLMGDGRPVLIASTTYGYLELFKTYGTRGNSEGFFVSIPPQHQKPFFSRVIGIGVGKLNKTENSHAIVVVTEDFRLCRLSPVDFSEMWSVQLTNYVQGTYHASISVLPERIYEEDEGTVAVAVPVAGANDTELMLFAAFNGANGQVRWRYTLDSQNLVEGMVGKDDEEWKEKNLLNGTSFLKKIGNDNTDRKYEKPWAFFREAIISALPHRYAHPWDEKFQPHVFFHAKNRKKHTFRPGNRVVVKYKDRIIRMNKEDYGALGERLGVMGLGNGGTTRPAKNRQRPVNALVFHTRDGIKVLHLYTGNVITSVFPLKHSGAYYHDINDDFQIDAIKTSIGPRTQMHGRHGVDLVDECLGEINTGAPGLEYPIFHATICDTEGFFGRLDLIHHFVDGDVRGEDVPHVLNTLELIGSRNVLSKNTQGVTPLVVQLHTTKGRGLFQVERHAVFMIDTGLVTSMDPLRRRVLWRSQTDAFFKNLREGKEADVGMAGTSERERVHRTVPFPHLATYSFYQSNDDSINHVGGSRRYLRTDPFIIAVGERYMSVLNSRNGRVLRTVELESPPVAPIIVQDFNGDGINDIILLTRYNIYGFIVSTQTSSDTITVLMILMVGLLVVLFVVREVNTADGNVEDLLPSVTRDVSLHAHKTARRATD